MTANGGIGQTGPMATFDHLGITVDDVPSASAQFHPVLEALGYTRANDAEEHAYWVRDG